MVLCFFFDWLEQISPWFSLIKPWGCSINMPRCCNGIVSRYAMRAPEMLEQWTGGMAGASEYTLSISACVCTSASFFVVSAHSSSLFLISCGGGKMPTLSSQGHMLCSSRHMEWLNQFHSPSLCSISRFLGTTDLAELQAPTSGPVWLLSAHCFV